MMHPSQLYKTGLPARIAEFFDANPDEELTYEDALHKFGCTQKHLEVTLARLRAVGWIETPKLIRRKR